MNSISWPATPTADVTRSFPDERRARTTLSCGSAGAGHTRDHQSARLERLLLGCGDEKPLGQAGMDSDTRELPLAHRARRRARPCRCRASASKIVEITGVRLGAASMVAPDRAASRLGGPNSKVGSRPGGCSSSRATAGPPGVHRRAWPTRRLARGAASRHDAVARPVCHVRPPAQRQTVDRARIDAAAQHRVPAARRHRLQPTTSACHACHRSRTTAGSLPSAGSPDHRGRARPLEPGAT